LDDALAVRDRPNIPGSSGRGNWCLALPVELTELANLPLPDRLADILTRSLRTARPASSPA
jgi:hypothetical protein